jgi:hypothetical protein
MVQLKCYERTFNSPAERELIKQTWIDLYDTEPIKLTLSIEDITNADATSTFSRTFKVPGTRNNAEFFNNAFDVDGTLFDVTVKKPAEILVDGAEFKQGHVRLQKIYLNTELDQYDYELIFLGETRDFSSKIGDRSLCQLQLNDVIGGVGGGPLTAQDIQTSWQAYPQNPSLTAGLHDGNIIYPLIDHGNTYDDDGIAQETRISLTGTNRFTQNSHPLTINRFKPMIRAKRIWDKIFEDAGYTYTSNFITSQLFHQAYISAFGNEATVGWDTAESSVNSNNIASASNNIDSQEIEAILLPQGINDPGSNLSVLSNFTFGASNYVEDFTVYTVPAAGEYRIAGQCYLSAFEENSDYVSVPLQATLKLFRLTVGGIEVDPTPLAESNLGGGFGDTLQFDTIIPAGLLNPGDRLFLFLGDLGGAGAGFAYNYFVADFNLNVVAAPGDFNPVTTLECTYKQIDFIKDMLTAFRLVLSPDPNNVQNFIVEPWQTYINSGNLHDWSDKLVQNKDVQIEPIFFNQSDELDFKFQPGGDFSNIYHQQAYSEPYGYLQFDSNNDLLIGKKEIKLTGIAPTILNNIEGSIPADLFNIPLMHTHSNAEEGEAEHLPIKPKTRFMFYNGLQPVNVHVWYLQGASPAGQNVYPLVSSYQSWPIQPGTLNLNWANDVQYWGTVAGYNANGSTLYNDYWSRYISFLYGKYSRRVTANFVLNNIDLNTFSFDDTIFVNGTYYRAERIMDVEIGAYTEVKVQLLTANDYRPPIIPFQQLLECSAVGLNNPCSGDNSYIEVTTNGTPPFTWQLSNGMSGQGGDGLAPGLAPYTFQILNVPPGILTLNVEDSLGRTKELTVNVPVPFGSQVSATVNITTATDCISPCNGEILVTPSGGTPPYTIQWADTFNPSFERFDLCPGDYYFAVYDSNDCQSQEYIVNVPCQDIPADVYRFNLMSNDCNEITQSTRFVFYPTPLTPDFDSFYKLSDLSSNPIEGCWVAVPTPVAGQVADSLITADFLDCLECQGIQPPSDICVVNFGASMAPCIGGTVDDHMEGYIDLSNITPTLAQFTLTVNYIAGTTIGNCSNATQQINLFVEVEAGQSQGLLTCDNGAPFIDFNGATICSVQFTSGDYPECIQPVVCEEFIIGGFDQGCTTYLDCDGISQEICYNGPAASGYDQESFCATEIVSWTGSEPQLQGLCPF